ncbi:hypothetical protein KB219_35395, partial [Pseudomonas aeruginosa]|nr:hypothetical protein [Pseudomonas aeruginosa]
LQPMAIALASVSKGVSVVTENLFEARFRFVEEMVRMGVDAETDGHHAKIVGRERLDSATVWASDIRAGAGLVLAGMCADDITEVCEVSTSTAATPTSWETSAPWAATSSGFPPTARHIRAGSGLFSVVSGRIPIMAVRKYPV